MSIDQSFGPSRRSFLASSAGAILAAREALSAVNKPRRTAALRPDVHLSASDLQFLEDFQKCCFRFFWEQWNNRTGLFLDRARMDGTASSQVSSIAATGFGLTALCIGAERGWVSREQVRTRILTTLRYLWGHAFHEHGWFLHFVDSRTGLRAMNSEVSSVDTALLLAGVLTAQGYFSSDREIHRLAKQIFERVDFTWMLNGIRTCSPTAPCRAAGF